MGMRTRVSSTVRRPAAPADTGGQSKVSKVRARSEQGQELLLVPASLSSRKFPPEQEVMSLSLSVRGAVELQVRGLEGGATV